MPRRRNDPRPRVEQDQHRDDCVILFSFNTFCRIPHTHLTQVADLLVDYAENIGTQHD